MQLVVLRRNIADAQAKYDDAVKEYDDLLKPPDLIDLQQAQADLAYANAQVDQAALDRDKLLNGPDPGEVAKAQARIKAAEAALNAAQASYADSQLVAGFPGQVISIPAKVNQWTISGQPFLYLADLTGWKVEIPDLEETDIPGLKVGQPAQVTFDALPDLQVNGTIESISLLNGEKDGDVTYKVTIDIPGNDPRLRWGLTSRVQFEP
jgi:HlyD family secretion protein